MLSFCNSIESCHDFICRRRCHADPKAPTSDCPNYFAGIVAAQNVPNLGEMQSIGSEKAGARQPRHRKLTYLQLDMYFSMIRRSAC